MKTFSTGFTGIAGFFPGRVAGPHLVHPVNPVKKALKHLPPKALLRAQGQPIIPDDTCARTPQRLRATIVLLMSYRADLGRVPNEHEDTAWNL